MLLSGNCRSGTPPPTTDSVSVLVAAIPTVVAMASNTLLFVQWLRAAGAPQLGEPEAGTMVLRAARPGGRDLPMGCFARWRPAAAGPGDAP